MSVTGDFSCPPPGRSAVHLRGECHVRPQDQLPHPSRTADSTLPCRPHILQGLPGIRSTMVGRRHHGAWYKRFETCCSRRVDVAQHQGRQRFITLVSHGFTQWPEHPHHTESSPLPFARLGDAHLRVTGSFPSRTALMDTFANRAVSVG